VANTLNLFRNGAVGFIDWLDASGFILDARLQRFVCVEKHDCCGILPCLQQLVMTQWNDSLLQISRVDN
jgi:hypothetical protein